MDRSPAFGLALLVLLPLVLLPTPAAGAPAQCPQPVRDRYEPGETVTIVGYGCIGGFGSDDVGRADVAPLYGYLKPDPCAGRGPLDCIVRIGMPEMADLSDAVPLGRFTLEETRHELRGLRMSLTFTLPADLAAGLYYVVICQDPCHTGLAHGTGIHVGVDRPPDATEVRYWPLDDPAIQDMPDDALLLGHDGEPVTAAEVRAGITRGRPEPATERPSVRTEAAEDDTDGGFPLGWVGGVAGLVAVGWVVARIGPGRKQVRSAR